MTHEWRTDPKILALCHRAYEDYDGMIAEFNALLDAVWACARGAEAEAVIGLAEDLERELREPCDSNNRMRARKLAHDLLNVGKQMERASSPSSPAPPE